MNTGNLYVITTWAQYSDTSMFGEDVYLTKEEAQAVVDGFDPKDRKIVRYSVKTLDEYIDEVKTDARWKGEHGSRYSY